MTLLFLSGLLVGGCTGSPPAAVSPGATDTVLAAQGTSVALTGGVVVGRGPASVRIEGDRITHVGEVPPADSTVDVTGQWIVPAFIDSHVHVLYLPDPEGLADGGVAAVVDLAAPLSIFDKGAAPLRLLASGPMVTASGGYPTQSWGANGYGIECVDEAEAVAAIDDLAQRGAGLIKLPVTPSPVLSEAALRAATTRAHELGLPVVSHALSDDEAALASSVGIDALAHTPTAPLSDDTVNAWADRAIISTLGAFGGGAATLDNLTALAGAGATVLYGTDFGNTQARGVDEREIERRSIAGHFLVPHLHARPARGIVVRHGPPY